MGARQSKIDKVIIHCTASPDGQDVGLLEINSWHKQRGFEAYDGVTFCGYHFIVRTTGEIEIGRPEYIVGAHTIGHNTGSIGIAWVGHRKMTVRQKTSLRVITTSVLLKHDLDPSHVFGHCEFTNAKTCPNFTYEHTYPSMDAFREILTLERSWA